MRERLRRLGLGERVIKTALAAALAWEVATHIPGDNPQPFFAPLAAILTLQITVAQSVSRAAQRVLGVVIGAAVGMLVSRATGVDGWSIGLVVLVTLVLGIQLKLGAQAIPEVAVSALLVMIIGASTPTEFALSRVVEAFVGALVGVSVNALITPPTYLPEVRSAVRSLVDELAAVLHELASGLSAGPDEQRASECLDRARALAAPLGDAQSALERAEESLRYNIFGADQRRELARHSQAVEVLERTALEVRGIARTLYDALHVPAGAQTARDWPRSPALNDALAGLLNAAARAVLCFWPVVESAGKGAGDELRRTLDDAAHKHQEVADMARQAADSPLPEGWIGLGSALADADKMLADIAAALEEIELGAHRAEAAKVSRDS